MEDPIYATFTGGAVLVCNGPGNYRKPGLTELMDMREALEAALLVKTAEVNEELHLSLVADCEERGLPVPEELR